jgi:hypothetical protein
VLALTHLWIIAAVDWSIRLAKLLNRGDDEEISLRTYHTGHPFHFAYSTVLEIPHMLINLNQNSTSHPSLGGNQSRVQGHKLN